MSFDLIARGIAKNASSGTTATKSGIGLGNVTNVDTSTTANIIDSSNKRFITDAQNIVLNNTSGINTGDQSLSGLVTKTTTVNSKALNGNIVISASDLTTGLLPSAQIPIATASTLGGIKAGNGTSIATDGTLNVTQSTGIQGVWNASTNTPTIPVASIINKGWYYIVSIPGTTSINGINSWAVNDWILSDGVNWSKIISTQVIATSSTLGSVKAGGNVTITTDGTLTTNSDATKVNTSTTVNGHTLSGNITLNAIDIGLGNVTNAQQEVITNKGIANGYAGLDTSGKVPVSQSPIGFVTIVSVATQTARLALAKNTNLMIALQDDTQIEWMINANQSPSTVGNWISCGSYASSVLSVNGSNGAVTINCAGLGAVPNTTTVNAKALSGNITLAIGDIITLTNTGSKFLRDDGTWSSIPSTLVQPFTGATSSTDGIQGGVPAPTTSQVGDLLGADGTWKSINPANSLYVGKNGNDITGDGSINNPYLTVNTAITIATAGTTIFIYGGTYTENLVLKAGVNLTSSIATSVNIIGNIVADFSGTVLIENIILSSTTGITLTFGGTNSQSLQIFSSSINSVDGDAINWTNSNSNSKLQLIDCSFSVAISSPSARCFYSKLGAFGAFGANRTSFKLNNPNNICLNIGGGNSFLYANESISGQVVITDNATADIRSAKINTTACPCMVVNSSSNTNVQDSVVSTSNTNAFSGTGNFSFSNVSYAIGKGCASTLNSGAGAFTIPTNAPKITPTTLTSTVYDGLLEYNSTSLYMSYGTNRKAIATQDLATNLANGLMSGADKTKLNGLTLDHNTMTGMEGGGNGTDGQPHYYHSNQSTNTSDTVTFNKVTTSTIVANNATPTNAGLLSTADKTKLDTLTLDHNTMTGMEGGGQGHYYHSNQATNNDSNVTFKNVVCNAVFGSNVIIVSASNSTTTMKSLARYQCDGTADEVEINMALANNLGATIFLADGNYNTSATINIPANTTLCSNSTATAINVGSTSTVGIALAKGSTLNGCTINRTGTNSNADLIDALTVGGLVQNCTIVDSSTSGITIYLRDSKVYRNSITYCHTGIVGLGFSDVALNSFILNGVTSTTGVQVSDGNTYVHENKFSSIQVSPSSYFIYISSPYAKVINNSFSYSTINCAINIGAGYCTVKENYIQGIFSMGGIVVIGTGDIIDGNIVYSSGGTGKPALVLSGANMARVTNNDFTSESIYAVSCTDAIVSDLYFAGNNINIGNYNGSSSSYGAGFSFQAYSLNNSKIIGNTFVAGNNFIYGILGNTTSNNNNISNNVFRVQDDRWTIYCGIGFPTMDGGSISNNTMTGIGADGICVTSQVSKAVISGNSIKNGADPTITTGAGIRIPYLSYSSVVGNTTFPTQQYPCVGAIITNNTCSAITGNSFMCRTSSNMLIEGTGIVDGNISTTAP